VLATLDNLTWSEEKAMSWSFLVKAFEFSRHSVGGWWWEQRRLSRVARGEFRKLGRDTTSLPTIAVPLVMKKIRRTRFHIVYTRAPFLEVHTHACSFLSVCVHEPNPRSLVNVCCLFRSTTAREDRVFKPSSHRPSSRIHTWSSYFCEPTPEVYFGV
jgi:hypothetical protein